MVKKSGLERGLSSLIPDKSIKTKTVKDLVEVTKGRIDTFEVPVNKIVENPMQPRKSFGHSELEDLINSIKEHGILQPLILNQIDENKYELIAGERRLRAAKVAGLKTVPVVLRTVGEMEKLELALIENIQRQDLNPIERAAAYKKLIDEFGLTQEETARRLGKTRTVVANAIRLLGLPSEIQKALADSKITEGHARLVASLQDSKQQLRLFKKILKSDFTVRETEDEVRQVTVKKHTRKIKTDPNLSSKEAALRDFLGTKVKINKKGVKGQIVIDFYSEEELNEVINKIV